MCACLKRYQWFSGVSSPSLCPFTLHLFSPLSIFTPFIFHFFLLHHPWRLPLPLLPISTSGSGRWTSAGWYSWRPAVCCTPPSRRLAKGRSRSRWCRCWRSDGGWLAWSARLRRVLSATGRSTPEQNSPAHRKAPLCLAALLNFKGQFSG